MLSNYLKIISSIGAILWVGGAVANETTGVSIGNTRLIYDESEKAISTEAINNENISYLVQSWVENWDGKRSENFMVSPPLLKLNPKQSNSIKISHIGGNILKDRETVYRLVVRFIPSQDALLKKSMNSIRFSTRMEIKVLFRPQGLSGLPEEAQEQLKWKVDDKKLTAINSTSYSVSLAGVKINGTLINNGAIVPAKGTFTIYLLKELKSAVLLYGCVNDYGLAKTYRKVISSNE